MPRHARLLNQLSGPDPKRIRQLPRPQLPEITHSCHAVVSSKPPTTRISPELARSVAEDCSYCN
jgi:hypothetical protein